MIERLKAEIIEAARQCYPREMCGVIIAVGKKQIFIQCGNMAKGTDHFILDPLDYDKAEQRGAIVAIVHSHPNEGVPIPSQADKVACEETELEWHIVSYPAGQFVTIKPEGYIAPLIGRAWQHGVLDCYSIIKDWYKLEKGILIPDFERSDEWWRAGGNLYVDNFHKAGFRKATPDEELEVGDVLLMQVLSNVPNHGAIYLGSNMFLHHLYNRLSCREIYGGYFRKHTTHHLKYEGSKENHIIR